MLLEILLGLACILGYCYWHLHRKWATFWAEQGVKTPPTSFPFGNSAGLNWHFVLRTRNIIDVFKEQYNMFKGEKVYGTYMLGSPQLVIRDADITKQIMVKDFNHFVDRHSTKLIDKFFSGKNTSNTVWRKQLTFLGGDEWKDMRSTFSPIFTSGKMKAMMKFIHHATDQLLAAIDQKVAKGEEIELKEYFGKFTMDTMASCAFGIDACSFTNPSSAFLKNASNIFRNSVRDGIMMILVIVPGTNFLMKYFDVPVCKPKEIMFFYDVICSTIKHRKDSKTRRNDLIDMMIDALKEEAIIEAVDEDETQFDIDSKLSHNKKTAHFPGETKELNEIAIISTALVFLLAGFDATSQTLSYASYQLAKNPDIQKRLQDEIDQAIENAGGNNLDYTVIQGLEYLDQLIHETLRMYPALGGIPRICSEDYILKMPGCIHDSIKLEKDTEVFISVAGLQMDPEHYPNPEVFDPDRFSKENKAKRHPYAFLGFGVGPRSCIGMRFALLEAKVALVSILAKYNFVKSEWTPEMTQFDPTSILNAPLQPLIFRLERR